MKQTALQSTTVRLTEQLMNVVPILCIQRQLAVTGFVGAFCKNIFYYPFQAGLNPGSVCSGVVSRVYDI